jgi:hypothetical protein
MATRIFSILAVLLFVLIPLTSLAEDGSLKTGYDIYHNIQLMDNPETPEQLTDVIYTTGYLAGYLDALVIVQTVLYNSMFPANIMTEEERKKFAKELNFHRVNVPDSGIAAGQTMLIYKKFAEKHPERLNETARSCLFGALVDAYGWK